MGELEEAAAELGGEGGAGEQSQEAWTPNDEALITPEEGADPVTWAEYRGRFVPKAELTKMRQQDSERFNQELQQYRNQLAASYEDALRRAQQQYSQQQQPKQQQGPNPLDAILSKAEQHQGWVNVDMIRDLVDYFGQQLSQRDSLVQRQMAALNLVYGNQKKLEPHLSSLMTNAQEGKLNKAMDSLLSRFEIGDDDREIARELIMDIVDSHEPGTLDFNTHLPEMFEKRWRALEKTFHRRAKAQVEKNRGIPGKGALGSPSLPVSDDGLSERELAAKTWEAIQGAPQT